MISLSGWNTNAMKSLLYVGSGSSDVVDLEIAVKKLNWTKMIQFQI